MRTVQNKKATRTEPSDRTQNMLPEKARIMMFLFICLMLVYGMFVVREFKDYDFARYDPGWMISTVMSIAEDGDLDLRNQLNNNPGQTALQISLGKDGQWYPLHEFLMPVATLPFYLVFGIFGCLVFNIVISILLMMVLFVLCARHVGYSSAFTATVLTAFTTLFLNYAYNYSLDIFAAFMLTLAYWCLVERRFLLTGLVWGLATYARLATAVTIFGFLVFTLLESGPRKIENNGCRRLEACGGRAYPALAYVAGGLPVALCFFMSNFLMFGSPLTTSYDRWLHFVNGQPVIAEQSSSFSCSALENLPEVLLDKKSGLVTGAPLIIVALAFGMRNFWLKARNEAILLIVTGAMLIILFSKYCNAFPGEPGNRYLMPVVALCAIPLAFAVEQCFGSPGNTPDKA
jgi:4-amino-4-deoxy-L-arabinose transferase-like glycosyltransferase